MEVATLQKQDDDSSHRREAYPHKLLHIVVLHRKDAGRLAIVGCRSDREQADEHQGYI